MMKKVFLDTNILIDYFARRGQFFQPAAQIVQLGQDRQCELLVSALSFATAIITRNSDDFDAAQIEVYEPQQFLDMLAQ